jgi:hypothetical protein
MVTQPAADVQEAAWRCECFCRFESSRCLFWADRDSSERKGNALRSVPRSQKGRRKIRPARAALRRARIAGLLGSRAASTHARNAIGFIPVSKLSDVRSRRTVRRSGVKPHRRAQFVDRLISALSAASASEPQSYPDGAAVTHTGDRVPRRSNPPLTRTPGARTGRSPLP